MYNNYYKDKYNKYKGKYNFIKFIKKQIGGNYNYKISISEYYDELLQNIKLNVKKIPIIFSINKYDLSDTLLYSINGLFGIPKKSQKMNFKKKNLK